MLSVTHLRIALDPWGEDGVDSPVARARRRSRLETRKAAGIHTSPDFPWQQYSRKREARFQRRAHQTRHSAPESPPQDHVLSPLGIRHSLEELVEHCDPWFPALYQALRGYYGERGRPPLPLFLALPEDAAVLLE